MKQVSFRKKIVLTTVILGFIMAILLNAFIFFYLRDVLLKQKLTEIRQLNIEQSHETSLVLKNNQLMAKMLGTRTRVREYLVDRSTVQALELTDIFASYVKDDPKYLAIYLLDENGLGLISTDERFIGEDYSFRDYFKQAMQGQEGFDILLGKTSNQFGYYFSYPVKDEQAKIIGVLVVKVSPTDIEQYIIDSEVAKTSSTMLVNRQGVIFFASKTERFLKSLGALSDIEVEQIKIGNKFLDKKIEPLQYGLVQNIVRNYTQPETIKFQDEDDDDQEVIGVSSIGSFPLYLVSETSLGPINNTILSTMALVIIITFLIVILAAFSLLRIFSIFLRPLEQLKIYVDSMSQGDFSKKINLKTKDEFNDLALAFNKMSSDLGNLYKNLDKKVAEQTKETTSKAKDLAEQQTATLNILEDVEQEKEKSELLSKDLEKFKLAVENASDHIIITDPDAKILYANKAVEKITGFKNREIISKKAGDKNLWGGQMTPDFYKGMWQTIKVDKKIFSGYIKNKRKNGEVYDAIASISPILDETGSVQFFVGIERDVTQERNIDRAKSEFVSLASHQLRTPLSAINWYAEMLIAGDAGKLNKEQLEHVKEIYSGNQRMVDLVNALLNVSRIELGRLAVEPAPTKLLEIADSVILELTPSIKLKKLKLIAEYDKKIPVINLDPKLMRIVFQNYLSNAVKYTPEKGTVRIKMSQDKKEVTIAVSDTGYGIPENQKDKIFQKLFRADNVRAMETEGTGLGLYIIKSVIEQFGGKVWFESKENKGSTFYATVPLKGVERKEGSKGLENVK